MRGDGHRLDEGLDPTDRRLLEEIVQKFGGGPVGVAAMAAVLVGGGGTIEDVYEPYLLRIGFLDRTPQGRVATDAACEHLRATAPGPAGPASAREPETRWVGGPRVAVRPPTGPAGPSGPRPGRAMPTATSMRPPRATLRDRARVLPRRRPAAGGRRAPALASGACRSRTGTWRRRRSCRWGRTRPSRRSTPTTSARSAPRSSSSNTYHLYLRPGHERIERLGGLHRVHGLGPADPHRLGRVPGGLPRRPPDDRRRRGDVPQPPRRVRPPLHARARDRGAGGARGGRRRRVRPAGLPAVVTRGDVEDATRADPPLGRALARGPHPPGPGALRRHPGGPGARPAGRGPREFIRSLPFDGINIGGLAGDETLDQRDAVLDVVVPLLDGRPAAALPHGARVAARHRRCRPPRASTCSTPCSRPASRGTASSGSPAAG